MASFITALSLCAPLHCVQAAPLAQQLALPSLRGQKVATHTSWQHESHQPPFQPFSFAQSVQGLPGSLAQPQPRAPLRDVHNSPACSDASPTNAPAGPPGLLRHDSSHARWKAQLQLGEGVQHSRLQQVMALRTCTIGLSSGLKSGHNRHTHPDEGNSLSALSLLQGSVLQPHAAGAG